MQNRSLFSHMERCGVSVKIGGLQKLTLLDYPGKTACTVFTWGCNLRCPFCHNAGLVTDTCAEMLAPEQILAFLEKRRGLLDGVCITGGEPLLQPDLLDFLKPVHEMGFLIKLDTNGTMPELLRQACESGLVSTVAMDIKNCPGKYAETVGLKRFSPESVQESVRYLMHQDKIPYEFRTTVVRQFHTAEDFAGIGRWIHGAQRYFLQNFQDSGHLIDSTVTGCTPAEMRQFLEIVRRDVPNAELRGI